MTQTTAATAAGDKRPAAPSAQAPDVVAPPPGNPRFPLFDSLRALAAISILLVHTAIFTGVFKHPSLRAVRRPPRHRRDDLLPAVRLPALPAHARLAGARRRPARALRDYARRRFLRIAPAYWLALTVLAIVPGIYGVFSGNWWVYYGLLQNYPVYKPTAGCVGQPVLPAASARPGASRSRSSSTRCCRSSRSGWLWLTKPLVRGTRWLWAELVVLTGIGAVSVLIQSATIDTDALRVLFFSPLGRGWWFGLGMGLAAISVWAQQRGGEPSARALDRATTRDSCGRRRCCSTSPPRCSSSTPGPSLTFRTISLSEYLFEYLLFGVIAALLLLPAIFGDHDGGLAAPTATPSRCLPGSDSSPTGSFSGTTRSCSASRCRGRGLVAADGVPGPRRRRRSPSRSFAPRSATTWWSGR